MSARQKLNQATIQGCLLLAGALGYAFRSWVVFAVTLMAALALSWYAGDIRTRPRH